MSAERDGPRSYELPWTFCDRVATEHFGSQKYSTSVKAIRELVANSLDADATEVRIELNENEGGGLDSVQIWDNGKGISPQVLAERFVVVGVQPEREEGQIARLGRFGVGRLAVHRIGTMSEWVSVSQRPDGKRVQVSFTLTAEPRALTVQQKTVTGDTPLGTVITIRNIRDAANSKLTAATVGNDLVGHFCSYLLANPSRTIRVQGDSLDVQRMVQTREEETIPPSDLVPTEARLDHLLLERPVDQSRFPAQVIFSGKGRTVASATIEPIPSPHYLGLVECPYLDSIVTSNRELLIEMDQ